MYSNTTIHKIFNDTTIWIRRHEWFISFCFVLFWLRSILVFVLLCIERSAITLLHYYTVFYINRLSIYYKYTHKWEYSANRAVCVLSASTHQHHSFNQSINQSIYTPRCLWIWIVDWMNHFYLIDLFVLTSCMMREKNGKTPRLVCEPKPNLKIKKIQNFPQNNFVFFTKWFSFKNRFEFFRVPKSVVDVYSVPSLSIQASTLTKSATNDGILHFSTAELPFIMYSECASAS